jgi:hypothetical protein
LESIELSRRLFPEYIDTFNQSAERTTTAESNQGFHAFFFPFEHGFNSVVMGVFYPTFDFMLHCFGSSFVPEEHALNVAADEDVGSGFQLASLIQNIG